jgi:putative glycerol-1-phosphate prenyltransferase
MTAHSLYDRLLENTKTGRKSFAVLIDPDKVRLNRLAEVLENGTHHEVDFFFVGGSLVFNDMLDEVLNLIRNKTSIPCILFPGNTYQLNEKADGILLLSLISGRNPELLIGQHVVAAPYLKKSKLEVLPTGYMLIDGGVNTSVRYISNTTPIPAGKTDIATATAMAGEMLGLKLLFLDAGSGATRPVDENMIRSVRMATSVPLIVGGGIRTTDTLRSALDAGADLIVVGDAVEKDPDLVGAFSQVFREYNSQNAGS